MKNAASKLSATLLQYESQVRGRVRVRVRVRG